ncbi:hypothetical protein NFI96_029958 [Prochilodus magdalenae]|nr:hypothetical protein NFI96_029958 [Prochilodus magdalenae]
MGFSVHMDVMKTVMCKQEDSEPRTTTGPRREGGAVTEWKAHLRSFINGLKPEIAAVVKSLCIAWDSGNLSQIQQYAVHAEKLLRERQKKTAEKRCKDLQRATLIMLQTARLDERIARGRKRKRKGQGCI